MCKKVLVTGIGGNVGQGVLRNILSLQYDIKLIGTNTEAVSGGNHLCHQVYQVPFAYNEGYIEAIREICKKEKINLIIPCTDYETYYLSNAEKILPQLACSGPETSKIFLDKYLTYLEFGKCNITFASSVLPSVYNQQFPEIIVKPRKGRGSREMYINPEAVESFSDDFVVQKLYRGIEITTSFYVTKHKMLLGHISFVRELSSGMTSKCSVVLDYNDKLKNLIQQMIDNFDITGCCNIQSVVTNEDNIIPFEVNCRVSGTNSIRSQFGFEDVRYIVEEYLYNKSPQKPVIKKGSAVRIFMDVIYPEIDIDNIKNITTRHYLF